MVILSHEIYGENTDIFWMVEISAATKLTTVRQKLCCRKSKLYRVTDASFKL